MQTNPRFESCYRFFDVAFALRSDSRRFMDRFAAMYRRFQVNGDAQIQTRYCVLVDQGLLLADEQVLTLNNPDTLFEQAYERILDTVIAHIRSHILIHAAVVSWRGMGLVLPAYSGHGKTTLILELVRRGFCFLSDEIAAFERHTGRLAPFPRSLRVRPGTLALCSLSDLPAPSWRDKRIVDIEHLRPGSLGEGCQARYLIVLSNPASCIQGPDATFRTLHLLPERITPSLMQALHGIHGVRDVSPVSESPMPALRMAIEKKARVTPHLQETFQKQGVRLLDIIRGGERRPNFDISPRVEPLSPTEAAIELVRRFRGGQDSVLLQEEHKDDAVRLFLEMTKMVSGLACYRLSVGRLDQMADLICELLNVPMNPTEVSA